MNHLESLVAEWFEYKGYFVRKNVKVEKLLHGGYAGELDVVAYHPETLHVLHIEPSSDADTWSAREQKYRRKFAACRKHIPKLLPWLRKDHEIEQWALIWGASKNHPTIGGGKVVQIWDFVRTVTQEFKSGKRASGEWIPENYPLLRTVQLTVLSLKPKGN
jgi:hypothetical protein